MTASMPLFARLLHNGIAVISLVGQKRLPWQAFDESDPFRCVRSITGCQFEAQRIYQGIADGMDLGVQASPRDANCLRTVFFAPLLMLDVLCTRSTPSAVRSQALARPRTAH